MDVLTGLGGASQEKSAARNFFGPFQDYRINKIADFRSC
jgi:hypothetical protein